MKTRILKTTTLALVNLLLLGCASTHRMDGGRSAIYGVNPNNGEPSGKSIEVLRFDLLGAMFRAVPFAMRSGLASEIDEPTAAAGYTALSATAAQSMAATSERHTNGTKVVTYGAQGFETKAQELAEILAEAERIKNGLPRRGEDPKDDPEDPEDPETPETPETPE